MKASDGIQDLLDRTGGARVVGTVTVDQVYAQIQHENLNYKHPRGGRAKYLEAPLFESLAKRLEQFSGDLLKVASEPGTSSALVWHHDMVSPLAGDVVTNAPLDFGDLRQSAATETKDGAKIVASRPADQPRLTDAELDAKDYLRSMGAGYR